MHTWYTNICCSSHRSWSRTTYPSGCRKFWSPPNARFKTSLTIMKRFSRSLQMFLWPLGSGICFSLICLITYDIWTWTHLYWFIGSNLYDNQQLPQSWNVWYYYWHANCHWDNNLTKTNVVCIPVQSWGSQDALYKDAFIMCITW